MANKATRIPNNLQFTNPNYRIQNLTGLRFGDLAFLDSLAPRKGSALWLCRCGSRVISKRQATGGCPIFLNWNVGPTATLRVSPYKSEDRMRWCSQNMNGGDAEGR